MTEEEDLFAGIELEFDEMEARRQAASAKKSEAITAIGHSPGSIQPPAMGKEATDEAPPPPRPEPTAPVDSITKQAPVKNFDYKPVEEAAAPPPPLWRSIAIVLGVLVAGGVFLTYWYRHDLFPPEPTEVVAQVSEGENNELVFAGKMWRGKFELDKEVEGTAHQVVRAIIPEMPFITHQMVLVTGDFADPERVVIGEISNNKVQFEFKVDRPEGEAIFINLIPANPQALSEILRINKSQYVVIIGDEVQGALSDPEGSANIESSRDSRVIRVQEILFDQAPPE